MIEKIEVVINFLVCYEVEGVVGVINIVLKKDCSKGFNGFFDINGGIFEFYGGVVNLNYCFGKFNWFMNYGLNFCSWFGCSSIE